MFDCVDYEVSDGVGLVRLNRPDQLNSFNVTMHKQLAEVLNLAELDEVVRAILLTGNGRGFCAGQDLSDEAILPNKETPPDLGSHIEQYYNPLVKQLFSFSKPVVCAVNGVAAGAGANIALACDIVIAGKSAKFIQSFCKIGLVPDSGGSWFLPRLVGAARARGLALLGNSISADQALDFGLIWQVVDDDSLKETSEKLAKHLATQPTKGLYLTKQALAVSSTNTLDEQLALERDLQREAGLSADYKEGVDAFMEKRKPKFKGH